MKIPKKGDFTSSKISGGCWWEGGEADFYIKIILSSVRFENGDVTIRKSYLFLGWGWKLCKISHFLPRLEKWVHIYFSSRIFLRIQPGPSTHSLLKITSIAHSLRVLCHHSPLSATSRVGTHSRLRGKKGKGKELWSQNVQVDLDPGLTVSISPR